MHFRNVLVVAAIALTFVLAGCTAKPAPTTGTTGGGDAQVEMKSFKFTPAEVTIKVGQNVTWTNKDPAPNNHDVTPKGSTESWSPGGNGGVKPGETFTRQFNEAGTFEYFCQAHGQSMAGKVIVTA